MFSKFKQHYNTVFLDPENLQEIDGIDNKNKIVLILSPRLYWVKKVSLPVKYLHEAKRLLPSLFEESIPKDDYSYAVYKKGDDFFVFAYQDSVILELLKNAKIEPSRIASVHFAQSAFDETQESYLLNEDDVMSVIDGVVVLLPKKWTKSAKDLILSDVKIPKESITLKQYGNIIDKKSFYKVVSAMGVFLVVLLLELFIANKNATLIENKNATVFQKYKLLPTTMQNKQVLQKYKKRYEKQIKLRHILATILSLPLAKGESITEMRFHNDIVSCTIQGESKNSYKKIEEILHKKKLKFHGTLQGDKLQIKVNL